MADLTEKQKRFADYYIETGNGAEAARKAGYKGNNHDRIASENLRKLDIRSYINERMSKKDNERIASQDEVLEYFTSLMRGRELDEVVAMNPGMGFERTEQRVDSKVRLSAAKELAKRYGIDKQAETKIDEGVQISWEE